MTDDVSTTSADTAASIHAHAHGWLPHMPSHWPMQGDLLQWCQTMSPGAAALLVMGGIVYLLYGYYIFRGLVILNAAMVGACIGAQIGEKAGSPAAGALVGAMLAAAVTWPSMKYAVAIMGGVFGALLGASLWRAFGLEPDLCAAGALSGLVLFGLLSFIVFRGSVMMYMSLQGSVMLIFGILGLVFKYQSVGPQITENMTLKPFLLPLSIFVPAVLGVVYQQTNHPATDGGDKK